MADCTRLPWEFASLASFHGGAFWRLFMFLGVLSRRISHDYITCKGISALRGDFPHGKVLRLSLLAQSTRPARGFISFGKGKSAVGNARLLDAADLEAKRLLEQRAEEQVLQQPSADLEEEGLVNARIHDDTDTASNQDAERGAEGSALSSSVEVLTNDRVSRLLAILDASEEYDRSSSVDEESTGSPSRQNVSSIPAPSKQANSSGSDAVALALHAEDLARAANPKRPIALSRPSLAHIDPEGREKQPGLMLTGNKNATDIVQSTETAPVMLPLTSPRAPGVSTYSAGPFALVKPLSYIEALYVIRSGDPGLLDSRSVEAGWHRYSTSEGHVPYGGTAVLVDPFHTLLRWIFFWPFRHVFAANHPSPDGLFLVDALASLNCNSHLQAALSVWRTSKDPAQALNSDYAHVKMRKVARLLFVQGGLGLQSGEDAFGFLLNSHNIAEQHAVAVKDRATLAVTKPRRISAQSSTKASALSMRHIAEYHGPKQPYVEWEPINEATQSSYQSKAQQIEALYLAYKDASAKYEQARGTSEARKQRTILQKRRERIKKELSLASVSLSRLAWEVGTVRDLNSSELEETRSTVSTQFFTLFSSIDEDKFLAFWEPTFPGHTAYHWFGESLDQIRDALCSLGHRLDKELMIERGWTDGSSIDLVEFIEIIEGNPKLDHQFGISSSHFRLMASVRNMCAHNKHARLAGIVFRVQARLVGLSQSLYSNDMWVWLKKSIRITDEFIELCRKHHSQWRDSRIAALKLHRLESERQIHEIDQQISRAGKDQTHISKLQTQKTAVIEDFRTDTQNAEKELASLPSLTASQYGRNVDVFIAEARIRRALRPLLPVSSVNLLERILSGTKATQPVVGESPDTDLSAVPIKPATSATAVEPHIWTSLDSAVDSLQPANAKLPIRTNTQLSHLEPQEQRAALRSPSTMHAEAHDMDIRPEGEVNICRRDLGYRLRQRTGAQRNILRFHATNKRG